MTIVSVEGAVCGFPAVISASRIDRDRMKVTVECGCETIGRWSRNLRDFDWRDSLRPDTGAGQLVREGMTISHAACPVTYAVRKAIEVEVGAALPRDIHIRFAAREEEPRNGCKET